MSAGRANLLRAGQRPGIPILVAGHERSTITVWNLGSRQRVTTIDGLGQIKDLAAVSNGLIIAASEQGLTAFKPAPLDTPPGP